MSKTSTLTTILLSTALAACSHVQTQEVTTRMAIGPITSEVGPNTIPVAVHFAFDHFSLDTEARSILDAQAALMNANETSYVVFGHADLVGTIEYNFGLGRRRAESVVDYLVARGVERSRLVPTVSYGELAPLVPVAHAERMNRRVVIVSSEQAEAYLNDPVAFTRVDRPEILSMRVKPTALTPPATSPTPGAQTPTPAPQSGTEQSPELQTQPTQPISVDADPVPGGGVSGEQPQEANNKGGNGNGANGNDRPGHGPNGGPGKGPNDTGKSSSRTDAGRGNGAEDGDPGNSAGRNNGGDDD